MDKAENPPAFARAASVEIHTHLPHDRLKSQEGMTLRDYFAAKVIQGIVSNEGVYQSSPIEEAFKDDAKLMAESAYAIADAMLKARAS